MSAKIIGIVPEVAIVGDGHAAADPAHDGERLVIAKIDIGLRADLLQQITEWIVRLVRRLRQAYPLQQVIQDPSYLFDLYHVIHGCGWKRQRQGRIGRVWGFLIYSAPAIISYIDCTSSAVRTRTSENHGNE